MAETEIPEDVMPLYASIDSTEAPSMDLVQFAHRLIENAAIRGGDMEPTTVEQGDLASSIARAILAERERCASIADVAADEKDVMALSSDESHFASYREGERTAKSIASSIRGDHHG